MYGSEENKRALGIIGNWIRLVGLRKIEKELIQFNYFDPRGEDEREEPGYFGHSFSSGLNLAKFVN